MIRIDVRSNEAIYEQIISQVKENILKGFLKSGDLIPSVRKLAIMLNINPNTVAKAYQELERQKIIITVRGKGTFIDNIDIENLKMNYDKLNDLVKKIKPLIMEMKYLGMKDEEIISQIETINKELSSNEKGENIND